MIKKITTTSDLRKLSKKIRLEIRLHSLEIIRLKRNLKSCESHYKWWRKWL